MHTYLLSHARTVQDAAFVVDVDDGEDGGDDDTEDGAAAQADGAALIGKGRWVRP